jgi:4-amino-4-deoxy-L-arabinose transferase-like glycosyltransferase
VSTHNRRLAATLLVAFGLRLLLLVVRGDYLVYDEGYYLLLARSLRAGHGFTLNGLPHVALSPLQPVLVAALSLAGVPDLLASRLLAAACGALLVIPVAVLARRWFDERVAGAAALFVAASPALLAFLPFFPGERWNLYFGSEPLYLLLGLGALAAAVRAVEEGAWRWWLALGALAAAAYLTRLEGAVLGGAIGLVVLGALGWRRAGRLVPRAAASLVVAVVVAAPYLVHLHGALGRWALSGRVQAAVADEAEAAPPAGAGSGSDAVRAFVWGGDRVALWRTLYALDARGERMASQYWGVPRRSARPAAETPGTRTPEDTAVGPEATAAPPAPLAGAPRASDAGRGDARALARALGIVFPWWFLVLAVCGVVWARVPRAALVWSLPVVAATLVPALLAYVEPRALLLLVPVGCILAAAAVVRAAEVTQKNPSFPRAGIVAPLAALVLLLVPTARDLARSWPQQLPLQRVASARRAVGDALARRLPAGAVLVAWHPAVAIYADRDWRVLPYDGFARILGYARYQGSSAVVFSTFEPSPLREAPRAFTVVLLDSAATGAPGSVRLEPVEVTPLMFVGRLAPEPAR